MVRTRRARRARSPPAYTRARRRSGERLRFLDGRCHFARRELQAVERIVRRGDPPDIMIFTWSQPGASPPAHLPHLGFSVGRRHDESESVADRQTGSGVGTAARVRVARRWGRSPGQRMNRPGPSMRSDPLPPLSPQSAPPVSRTVVKPRSSIALSATTARASSG